MIVISHSQYHYFIQILLAFFIGSVIGWQRQLHGSPAGLRTHILVCVGATLLTVVDMLHSSTFQGKIAAAVVTGIGFLGAGTIIHSDKGDAVRGLTTAASVWVTAGIGIALGVGGLSTWIGAFVAFLVLATLSIVYQIEDIALRNKRNRSLTVIISRPEGGNIDAIIARVIGQFTGAGAVVQSVAKDPKSQHQGETVIHCELRLPDGFQPALILQACAGDADVVQANWDL